jgi:pilus assembly protein CpaE
VIHRFSIESFPLNKETETALEGIKTQREFAKVKLTQHFGGLARAAKHYVDNPTPEFIIVEETGSLDEIMQGLASLAEVVEPGCKVIVIGALNDVGSYRRLISQGISEYLVGPVTAEQIGEAVTGMFKDDSAGTKGRVIAFCGARGGVGSSTLAANLAWTMADMTQKHVIGLDLDLAFGTMALSLNLDPKQPILEAMTEVERIDAVLIERFLLEHNPYLSVLSTAGSLKDMPNVTPEMVERLIDVSRRQAQFLVLDVPHIWSDWVSSVLLMADDVVVTACADLANLRDAKMIFDWFKARREDSPNRLILNRIDANKKNQLSVKDFQDTLGVAPAMTVDLDIPLFANLANNGQMVGEGAKTNKLAGKLRHLAQQLGGRQGAGDAAQAEKKSGLSWLKLPGKK